MNEMFENDDTNNQRQTFTSILELFENITIENIGNDIKTDYEDVGTGRSSSLDCNDVHSVFAFLAFLFALLNFVLNMVW